MRNNVFKNQRSRRDNYLNNNVIPYVEEEQERVPPTKPIDRFEFELFELKRNLGKQEYLLRSLDIIDQEYTRRILNENASKKPNLDYIKILTDEQNANQDKVFRVKEVMRTLLEYVDNIRKERDAYLDAESEKLEKDLNDIIVTEKQKIGKLRDSLAEVEEEIKTMQKDPDIGENKEIMSEMIEAYDEAKRDIAEREKKLDAIKPKEALGVDKVTVVDTMKKLVEKAPKASERVVKALSDKIENARKVIQKSRNPFDMIVDISYEPGKYGIGPKQRALFNRRIILLKRYVDDQFAKGINSWSASPNGFLRILKRVVAEVFQKEGVEMPKTGGIIELFNNLINNEYFDELDEDASPEDKAKGDEFARESSDYAYKILNKLYYMAFPPPEGRTEIEQNIAEVKQIQIAEDMKKRYSQIRAFQLGIDDYKGATANAPKTTIEQTYKNVPQPKPIIKEGEEEELPGESQNQGRRGGYLGGGYLGGDLIRALSDIGAQKMPASALSMVKRYGNWYVRACMICKDPITKFASDAIDYISAGKFKKLLKETGADDAFHTFAVVKLQNPQTGELKYISVEKNQQISITDAGQRSAQYMEVLTLPDRVDGIPRLFEDFVVLGLNLLARQLRAEGHAQGPFDYNPQWNNCQVFLAALIEANGMMDERAKKFIIQDTAHFFGKLDRWSQAIANGSVTAAQFIADLFQ